MEKNPKYFKNFKSLDMFIQSSLDKFFFVEPWDKLYERTGKLHRDIISDKSTIPDLIIYNKTFNKSECFFESYKNNFIKFPRMRFILRPKFKKLYNPSPTYGKDDEIYYYNIKDKEEGNEDEYNNNIYENDINEEQKDLKEVSEEDKDWNNNNNVDDYDYQKNEFQAIPKFLEDKIDEEIDNNNDFDSGNINNISIEEEKKNVGQDNFIGNDIKFDENNFQTFWHNDLFNNNENTENNENNEIQKIDQNYNGFIENKEKSNEHFNIFDVDNDFNNIFSNNIFIRQEKEEFSEENNKNDKKDINYLTERKSSRFFDLQNNKVGDNYNIQNSNEDFKGYQEDNNYIHQINNNQIDLQLLLMKNNNNQISKSNPNIENIFSPQICNNNNLEKLNQIPNMSFDRTESYENNENLSPSYNYLSDIQQYYNISQNFNEKNFEQINSNSLNCMNLNNFNNLYNFNNSQFNQNNEMRFSFNNHNNIFLNKTNNIINSMEPFCQNANSQINNYSHNYNNMIEGNINNNMNIINKSIKYEDYVDNAFLLIKKNIMKRNWLIYDKEMNFLHNFNSEETYRFLSDKEKNENDLNFIVNDYDTDIVFPGKIFFEIIKLFF